MQGKNLFSGSLATKDEIDDPLVQKQRSIHLRISSSNLTGEFPVVSKKPQTQMVLPQKFDKSQH